MLRRHLVMIERTCERAECGNTFEVPYPSFRKRHCSRSCSALDRRPENNSNWRGGKTKHPLYASYLDMVARCTRPTHHAYSRYGGRGITVSEAWRSSFWTFVDDMGERPALHSLDRVDNDGPYSKENCRWATFAEQSKNRRPLPERSRDEKGKYA